MNYEPTHQSHEDGSPAMMVSETEDTITLVNEDGFQWTDPTEMWCPILDDDGFYPDHEEDVYWSGTGELMNDDSYIDYLNRY